MPTGPSTVSVFGQTKEVQSTYSLEIKDNAGSPAYLFSPDGLTNNPTLTLFKGQTYRFSVNTPNYPIAFVTKVSFNSGIYGQQMKQQIHHFYIRQELQNMI